MSYNRLLLTSLLVLGCSSDPPKQTPTKDVSPDQTQTEDMSPDLAPDEGRDVALDVVVDVAADLIEDVENDVVDMEVNRCEQPLVIGEGTIVEGPRAYHGVAFDDVGRLVGNDLNNLVRSVVGGAAQLWVPNVDVLEQIEFTDTGDLIAAGNFELFRITPDGSIETIAVNTNYGVTVTPSKIYATTGYGLAVVDIASGESEQVVMDLGFDVATKVVAVNADETKIFIGTVDYDDSSVFVADLDANKMPILPIQFFASVGDGYQDAMVFDECGFLWITDFESAALYRVSPDAVVEKVVQWASPVEEDTSMYGHGITFGTGKDGWRSDAIYLPMPYNSLMVQEIVVGVHGQK